MQLANSRTIQEPLPWGIPLSPLVWIPAALFLAVLPVALGVVARARDIDLLSPPGAAQRFVGSSVVIHGSDDITGPVSITALRCELSGSFPASISFQGRTLVLAPDFKTPALDARCAIIEGRRDGIGRLSGSYQAFR